MALRHGKKVDRAHPGRSPMLAVRVTADLMERLQTRAENIGIAFPEYIRWVLKKAVPPPLDEPLMTEEDLKEPRVPGTKEEEEP